jgi:hypothetical protein
LIHGNVCLNRAKAPNEKEGQQVSDNLSTRFDAAMKEIRKSGVKAQRNVNGCCRGCINTDTLNAKQDQKIIWHFGGQGNRFQVYADGAYEPGWDGSEVRTVYFNHDNLDEAEIADIVAIFNKHDIAASNEGLHLCIVIDFEASKRRDPKAIDADMMVMV